MVAFLGGLAGIKLLTNMMMPEDYGELALGLSLAGVVNLFVFGPLGQVALRFYSACRDRSNVAGYTRVLMRLHGQAFLFLAFISMPLVLFVWTWSGSSWAWLLSLALAFGISSGVQGTLLSLLGALRDRKMGAIAQGLDTWLRLGFAVVLMVWVGSQGYWAMAGYAAGSLAIVIIQLRALRRHGFSDERQVNHDAQDAGLRAEFLAYGLPFLAFAGLASISQYADRWLLQSFWSAAEVGIYAAMFQIASAPIGFLMGVATQLIIPVVFSRSGNLEDQNRTRSSQRLLKRSVMVVGSLYLLVTLIAYVWGDTLLAWLTNTDYSLNSSSLWLIVLSQALFNLAQFMVASGLSLNRPMAYFVPKLGQAASLLLLGALLVRSGGIQGMAVALLVSSSVYFIWVAAVNYRLWQVHIETNAESG
jgi:O-antigen/teichoic acid export membrane protein